MTLNRKQAFFLGSCCGAVLAVSSANGQSYTFVRIADSATGPFDPFEMAAPALNSSGVVVFRAAAPKAGITGIYTGSGAGITEQVNNSSTYGFIGRYPEINASGQTLFPATLSDEGEGVFRVTGGTVEAIADTTSDGLGFFAFFPTLNDAGQAAFVAEKLNFDNALFVGDGSTLTEVPEATGLLSYNFGGPDINNTGQIAYLGNHNADGYDVLVRREPDGTGTVIADTRGTISVFDDLAMNDSGRIAAWAIDSDGQVRIAVGDENGLTVIAPSADAYSFGSPAIDGLGRVAYVENKLDLGDRLIWNGRVVLETGDALDGAAVVNLVARRGGINDAGQIAFLATLDDGRAGIYRADPCFADFNLDGFVNGDDFDQYVAAFAEGNAAADFNRDGFVTGDDFDAYVAAFQLGC